jgi:CBS domain containing-hemolysin-like protein
VNWDLAIELLWKSGAVLVLVALNGFFVAAEFALVRIRDSQLDVWIARGQRRARATRRVLRHLDASLSACQLGITLASLALGWVGEPIFSALLRPLWPWLGLDGPEAGHLRETIAVVVGFISITFLHITAGEQAPKWLAIQRSLPVALNVAPPLEWFHKLSYPFIWVLNRTSLWILDHLGLEARGEAELAHSEEELRLLVAGTARPADETPFSRQVILNAFDLRHRVAREVMRPRHEIVALSTADPLEQCLETAEKTRYSRFPLCERGDLDRTLGVVHIKDLYALRTRARTGADLLSVARKLLYVPETARLDRLLQLCLERKLHLAIVVDEYGSTTGLLTLENILEELVGQIQDEFDLEPPLCVRTGPDTWELDGRFPLHELAELVGQPLQAEDLTTTSGLVTHRLGGFPKPGDAVNLGDYRLSVEETDGHRVTRLKLTRSPAAPAH